MKQIFKTTLLMAILTGLFMMVGYVFGGQQGMLIALGLAAVSNFFMYFFSSSLVIKMQGAQPLGNRYPQVERIVRELAAQANLPMPKLYYVETPIPNAFATGRSPQHAAVAVTTGIMDILNEDELRAVLAHELGHVKHHGVTDFRVADLVRDRKLLALARSEAMDFLEADPKLETASFLFETLKRRLGKSLNLAGTA